MSVRSIILTRPEDDSLALADKLPNITTIIAPLTRIRHLPDSPLVVTPKAWLATSRHALSHVNDATRKLPWFAVGARTAEVAAQMGFPAPQATAETALELAEILLEEPATRISPLLYLAAAHTRFDFANALQTHAIDVINSIVYEAEELTELPQTAQDAMASGAPLAIAFYSARSARLFYSHAAKAGLVDAAKQAIACCISAEVAAACPVPHCVTASAPTGSAMRQLLLETATV